MPRKVVKTIIEEDEPEEMPVETIQEEVISKPKKVLSEVQLANLERAREAAALKKRQLKQEKDKARLLEVEQMRLKAMEYDQVKAKQQEMVQVPPAPELKPTKAKKVVKKIIEVEEDDDEPEEDTEYEEVVVKRKVGRPRMQTVAQAQPQQQNYNHLLYKSAQETIQQKIMEERAKNLVNALMPRC